jgi:hypothetical protein
VPPTASRPLGENAVQIEPAGGYTVTRGGDKRAQTHEGDDSLACAMGMHSGSYSRHGQQTQVVQCWGGPTC